MMAVMVALLSLLSAQAATPWWRTSVGYEIFVRSFQDSDGDGIGDLKGIASRLDYLRGLGVDVLWLTPIYASPSYHGYDSTDYRSINPAYGTRDDFHELVRAAHERGLRVVLDFAANHTSIEHPWFGTRPDWYCWADRPPGWGTWHERDGRYYYSRFSAGMPDLNLKNRAVVEELKDTLRYWLRQGADGFRLDAVRYFIEGPRGESDTPETHAFIAELAAAVRAEKPDALVVGEPWAEADVIGPYVADGRELDLAFNFPVSGGVLGSLREGTGAELARALEAVKKVVASPERLSPILTNHDMGRIASDVGGKVGKLKLAATVLLTLPGTPFLYYGEEIGLVNGRETQPPRDYEKRAPMQWDASAPARGFSTAAPWQPVASDDAGLSVAYQRGKRGSLLEYYRKLIRLRRAQPTLNFGALELLPSPRPELVVYARRAGGEVALIALNFGAKRSGPFEIELAAGATRPRVLWGRAHPRVRPGASAGRAKIEFGEGLPALGASVLTLSGY